MNSCVVSLALGATLALASCATPAQEVARCVEDGLGSKFVEDLEAAEAALLDQGVLASATREGYRDLNLRIREGEVADGTGCREVWRRAGSTCAELGYVSRYGVFAMCIPGVGERVLNGSPVPLDEATLRGLTDEELRDIHYRGAILVYTLGELDNIE